MSISRARSMRNDKQRMSLLRIVQRLCGHVYDLLFLIKGTENKDLETTEMGLVLTECMQRAVVILALQTSILKKISIFIKKITPVP